MPVYVSPSAERQFVHGFLVASHEGNETRLQRRQRLGGVVKAVGGRFSFELGIDLSFGKSGEIFKWFLAAILFGARISETLAVRTYREFEKNGLLTPKKIVDCGWDGLVEVLDSGGYVRYDFKTATKLLDVNRTLLDSYAGDLNKLHTAAADRHDLEERLKGLGKGIGDVTVNIFLRELRGIWQKAEPLPSDLVLLAAKDLGLLPRQLEDRRQALTLLTRRWMGEGNRLNDFADFEAALLRRGLELRRKTTRTGTARR